MKKISVKDFEKAVVELNNLAIKMWNEAVAEDRAEELLDELSKDSELYNVYKALTEFNN